MGKSREVGAVMAGRGELNVHIPYPKSVSPVTSMKEERSRTSMMSVKQ